MAAGKVPIVQNGTLSTTIGNLYIIPSPGNTATINSITFNNTASSSWTLTVYKKISSPSQTILLYQKTLDAGDTVVDTTPYYFGTGTSLQAYASVATVSYSIQGYTETA